MNTLGAYDNVWPAFASTIYFELRNKSGDATLNIWYRRNNNFTPITIQGCSADCLLSDAQSILSPWLIDSDTYATECEANSSSLNNLDSVEKTPAVSKAFNDVTAFTNARNK